MAMDRRRDLTVILLVMVLLSYSGMNIVNVQFPTMFVTATSSAQEWETMESEHFIIKYHPGYEDDAQKTLDCAIAVRERTLKMYPHELSAKVTIYVYSSRDDLRTKKGVSTALSEVGYGDGTLEATIHILRPSWEGHWGGYEQLDDPFRRVLNHEYVHVPFYNDLYSKERGYKHAPSWFSQGIAEYISQNYLPSYEERVQKSVQQGSFMIDEPYSWGLYIVEYMYATYGREKIVNLIRSDASTFEDALRKEPGVSPSEFENGWKTYLSEKFGVPTPTLTPTPAPKIQLTSFEISKDVIKLGEPVTVKADVINIGDVAGECKIDLWLDGRVTDFMNVKLEPQELKTIKFEIHEKSLGTHIVKIGYEGKIFSEKGFYVASLTPTPTPTSPGFEAFFAISGLLAVTYFLLRRRKK
jgi:hypothetical protein